MNGNQGLEALAALCGGESAVPTDSNSTSSNNNNNYNGNQSKDHNNGSSGQSQHSSPSLNGQGNQLPDSLTRQQWQQAVAAAAALQGNNGQGATGLTAQSLALLSAAGLQQGVQQHLQQFQQQQQSQQQQQQQTNQGFDQNAALAAMQQLAYFRYFQEQSNAANKIGQAPPNSNINSLFHSNPQAMALALAGQSQPLQQQHSGRQVLPSATAPTPTTPTSNGQGHPESSSSSNSSMPPPPNAQGGASLPSTLSTAGISSNNSSNTTSNGRQHTAIAPLPNTGEDNVSTMTTDSGSGGEVMEDKKLQKRAANRRSAQLSRKRKKQFIEELKDENDELRRKEQILKSIPDLIVVFDSSGKLWFVSQSVSRFMNFTSKELEGTSFWDRLCEDSVRLLKAAFMDSLAARTDESDTAPLGAGIWELRLVDKDNSHKVVSLNGVVHFSGDRPECVCSIRPRDDPSMPPPRKQRKSGEAAKAQASEEDKTEVTVSSGNGSSKTATTSSTIDSNESSVHYKPLMRVKPQQSVMNNSSSSNRMKQKVKAAGGGKRREAARISDGDSVSGDTCSSDEMGE